MLILFIALIFGIVVLLLLLRSMPTNFRDNLKGHGREKTRTVIKLILLLEIVLYILIFLVIILKTIFV